MSPAESLKKIRILVADDHPAFREGLRRLLKDEGDMDVVGAAETGEEAVRLGGELLPDVAVIDVAMPGLGGIEAARQLKQCSPDTVILMITAYDYQAYIMDAIRAGADGYLLKDTPLRELIGAIRMLNSGKAIFDRRMARQVLHLVCADGRPNAAALPQPRELAVLKLAAKGMSNREIGQEMSIGERTVQTHLINIFHKLDVNSRTEAVTRAMRLGWLSMDDLPR